MLAKNLLQTYIIDIVIIMQPKIGQLRMTRFCSKLLLITLLFPPASVASISIACSMPDVESMPMAHPMSEEPVDSAHACCTMPEPETACELEIVADTFTCCDEVRISRDHGMLLTTPIPRYSASDMSLAERAISSDQTVDTMSISRIASAYQLSYLKVSSPPLRSLLRTYLI